MVPALREDLFFCLTDRCAIFLDLRANRYFGLTGFADIAFRRIVSGDALDADLDRALEPLRSKGLLIDTKEEASEARRIAPSSVEKVATSLVLPAASEPLLTGIALGTRARAAAGIRMLGLKAVVAQRRTRKAAGRAGAGPPISVERIARAHLRVDGILGGADQCLLRSIALVDHLARHGHFPQLVIGVRTGAFSAHCWVQQGPILLNDEVDRVQLFTPIMVL